MATIRVTNKVSDVSACIIAGGKGRRFGGDKLNHPLRGKPLIAHVAEVCEKIFAQVAIIADDRTRFAYLPFPCYEDLLQNAGPLVGIMTALEYSPTKKIFAVAGDMPSLSDAFIRYLVELSSDFDVTVPLYRGHYEPLHAVYSTRCQDAIRRAIENGDRQIVRVFPKLDVREVTDAEIEMFGNPEEIFYNINFREDA